MHGQKPAVLVTLVAGLLWGSSFVVVKVGLADLDPYWFVFLRFATAAVIAFVVAWHAGAGGEALRLLRRPLVLWLGVSNAVGFVLQFKGQTITTAGKAALLVNSNTVFVAIASCFVFRERLGWPKALAVVAGMAGVVLVTTGGRVQLAQGPALAGDLFVLGAALVWTVFVLLDKKVVATHEVGVRALTAAMLAVTAVASLPAALVLAPGRFPRSGAALWPVGYTAVFCTVLPFMLWTWGLKFITATTSSVILLTEIVFALALAAVLLDERLSTGALWGSLLIVLAVFLASREAKEELAAGPDVVPE